MGSNLRGAVRPRFSVRHVCRASEGQTSSCSFSEPSPEANLSDVESAELSEFPDTKKARPTKASPGIDRANGERPSGHGPRLPPRHPLLQLSCDLLAKASAPLAFLD